jgi:diguanylate cyclase (GGDEF)-like protein/PAS domain S-box-containing protein
MTPLTRGAAHVREHAELYRMAAGAVAAGLLVVLFVLTQPVDLRRHNFLLSRFSQLQSDEARLGEAVLQLNFNMSNNYDQVTAIVGHMRHTVRELNENKAAADLRRDAEFRRQLTALDDRLSIQDDALERFKSSNAVLKNSLIYLPHARDGLDRQLPAGSKVRARVDDLLEQVLLNRINGALLDRGSIGATIDALEAAAPDLPPATRDDLVGMLRHVRQIDQFERDLPVLVKQLTSQSANSGLTDAYRRYYDDQQRRSAAYRLFLLLLALALLAYATRAFIRMRDQSKRLHLAARVFATASEGITITDAEGKILDVNTAFTAVTGYAREEVIGKSPRILKSGRHSAEFYEKMWQAIRSTGRWQGEIWNRRKNGEIYPEWLTITAGTAVGEKGGEISHYVATFSDITQRKKDEAEIYLLAFYDPLTELPNRRLLMDRLHHRQLAGRGLAIDHAALLFIDVDNFKTLNDIRGHDIGDMLLIDIAQRLRTSAREGDTVARLGGDEFVVMLEGLSAAPEKAAAQAKVVGEKIHRTLNKPYWLGDFEHHSTCSIGISMFDSHGSAEELLKHADTAMYEAKAAGRNALRFFDPAMQAALEARARLEADLRQALEQKQFVLHYQIQVDAKQQAVGVEALLRWNRPQHGLALPGGFIPLAEETGLIQTIGHWVLNTACAQIKAWESNAATRGLVLAINVSARQFNAEDFVQQVESTLLGSGIDPSRLKLEITESMLLHDVEKVISTMRQLKALGVSFSIDDFGTGYSSLQYLKRLPLDQIKIDQSFVRDIAVDANDQAIVRTIIAMAQSMNLGIIAEGVETEQQRQLIASKGCYNYQGYLFGRPVPIDEFERMLG